MTLDQMEADAQQAATSYDCFRVAVWQRRPSDTYPGVGYARRQPSPFLALWRALVEVFTNAR